MTRLALPAFVVALSVALPLAARAGVLPPPMLNCPSDITTPSSGPTVITYSASCSDEGEIQSFACVPPSGSTFPVGITTVTCVCADVAGNTATCSFTVSVVGPTPTPTATATATATATGTATVTVTNTPTASPVPQGGACSTPSQCGTDNCANGVCCDTACDQPLQQCNLPGQVGTCASTAAGAPAMTPWGLLAAAGMLAGIAGIAIRRRLRRG